VARAGLYCCTWLITARSLSTDQAGYTPGRSQISTTAKYAHVLPHVMTDVADRIGQALWGQS
jgi:hypothetical protein